MGKGICADSYVGDREAQELFRREMGGSGEYVVKKKRARAGCGHERKIICTQILTQSI